MKYLKLFEGLNKRTVNFNKIYCYSIFPKNNPNILRTVGKFSEEYGLHGLTFYGYVINTNFYYSSKKGEYLKLYVKGNDWKHVREAVPEEIEFYEFYDNMRKYNL